MRPREHSGEQLWGNTEGQDPPATVQASEGIPFALDLMPSPSRLDLMAISSHFCNMLDWLQRIATKAACTSVTSEPAVAATVAVDAICPRLSNTSHKEAYLLNLC
eukprot:1155037-Pelagomonas_calceolata.AAC.7